MIDIPKRGFLGNCIQLYDGMFIEEKKSFWDIYENSIIFPCLEIPIEQVTSRKVISKNVCDVLWYALFPQRFA